MIVNEFYIGTTKVYVDDTYKAKTELEKKNRYELFNAIGCEIINNSID